MIKIYIINFKSLKSPLIPLTSGILFLFIDILKYLFNKKIDKITRKTQFFID